MNRNQLQIKNSKRD